MRLLLSEKDLIELHRATDPNTLDKPKLQTVKRNKGKNWEVESVKPLFGYRAIQSHLESITKKYQKKDLWPHKCDLGIGIYKNNKLKKVLISSNCGFIKQPKLPVHPPIDKIVDIFSLPREKLKKLNQVVSIENYTIFLSVNKLQDWCKLNGIDKSSVGPLFGLSTDKGVQIYYGDNELPLTCLYQYEALMLLAPTKAQKIINKRINSFVKNDIKFSSAEYNAWCDKFKLNTNESSRVLGISKYMSYHFRNALSEIGKPTVYLIEILNNMTERQLSAFINKRVQERTVY